MVLVQRICLPEPGVNRFGGFDAPVIEPFEVSNPFLVYRNKVATTGFTRDIQNVPCFRGRGFTHAPWVYAASPANMGRYAPIDIECPVADFLDGRCGQDSSYSHR